ncbi:MAG: glycosyltransferase family 39 protein [Chloroflexota bacterium]
MLICVFGTVFAALPPAVLWALSLHGRSSIVGLSAQWLLTCLGGWLAVVLWSIRGGVGSDQRAGPWWLGLTPAALLSASAVVVLYASPVAYHAWVFAPRPKGLLVPTTVLLAVLAPAIGRLFVGDVPAAQKWVETRWRAIAALLIGGFAVGHALSYSQVATDDLIRYWAIADAWAAGAPYAVAEGDPGAREFYLVDLPFYPALVSLGFNLIGHRYIALHAPLALANVALPFLLYGASRAIGATRATAACVALIIVALPMAQVYAFGSAEPDPIWAALLAALVWLGTRLSRPDATPKPLREWVALGLVAALLVLTRPEGPLYAAPLLLGLVWQHRRSPSQPLASIVVAGIPAAAFSAFLIWAFGIVWPAGFGNVASLQHVPRNVELVLRQNLPHYAALMGLPAPDLTGPLAAAVLIGWLLVGALRIWRRFPGLRLYLIGPALNLAVILLSPTNLAADHFSPPTFFRHWAIALPWLAPALAVSVPRGAHATGPTLLGALFIWQSLILLALPLPPERVRPPILTSDPYVLLTDLAQIDAPLPHLPFVDGPGQAVAVDPSFAYLPFRQRLFDAMGPYNLHANDSARAHVLASLLFGLSVLSLAWMAGQNRPPDPAR